MAFKAKFLFITEKLLPKNIFKEIKKICHPAIKRTSVFLLVNLLLLVRFQVHLFLNE